MVASANADFMIWPLALKVLFGLALLTVGAERFIVGASAFGKKCNIPPIIIGMLLVGFGTSLPECLVAWLAAIKQHPAIGIGSAIGSNITNIGLVLGISALIIPLRMHSRLLKREFPWLVFVGFLVFFMLRDAYFTRADGIALLCLLVVNLFWICYWVPKHDSADILTREFRATTTVHISLFLIAIYIVLGLAAMLYGADLTVVNASRLASYFGVSELVIGLTIIAVGTSLPELAATIISAIKREHDIAVGNVIGSNIFNLLGVMAGPAIIAPGRVSKLLVTRDIPFMLALTLVLWLFAFLPPRRGQVGRLPGLVFLLSYIGYLYFTVSRV